MKIFIFCGALVAIYGIYMIAKKLRALAHDYDEEQRRAMLEEEARYNRPRFAPIPYYWRFAHDTLNRIPENRSELRRIVERMIENVTFEKWDRIQRLEEAIRDMAELKKKIYETAPKEVRDPGPGPRTKDHGYSTPSKKEAEEARKKFMIRLRKYEKYLEELRAWERAHQEEFKDIEHLTKKFRQQMNGVEFLPENAPEVQ